MAWKSSSMLRTPAFVTLKLSTVMAGLPELPAVQPGETVQESLRTELHLAHHSSLGEQSSAERALVVNTQNSSWHKIVVP